MAPQEEQRKARKQPSSLPAEKLGQPEIGDAKVLEPPPLSAISRLRSLRESSDEVVLKSEIEADTRAAELSFEQAETTQKGSEKGETVSVGNKMAAKKRAEELTPEAWLAQISELFRAGQRREAEASLEAFQESYPNYTDYPESLPDEVLDGLRPR